VDLGFLTAILTIIAIDLVLSGDNAVVIAMASRRLPPAQRRKAIIWGGGGAVVLRILFTILASLLLSVPLLQAAGGILLIYIAIKLLRPHTVEHGDIKEANTMAEAIRTIIMADVVMSLDNMLAVGGAAHGNLGLLIFGLALSIPILLFGSSAIARMIDRYPWLNYVGAAILVHTAIVMFFEDKYVHDALAIGRPTSDLLSLVPIAIITALGIWWSRREAQAAIEEAVARGEQRPFGAPEPGD
jgi:YjbE family integral membrane protein